MRSAAARACVVALLGLAGAGCHDGLLRHEPPAPPPPPTIRLCGKPIPGDAATVRETVLGLVRPGTAADMARTDLEGEGFVFDRMVILALDAGLDRAAIRRLKDQAGDNGKLLGAHARRDVVGDWGRAFLPIHLVLVLDCSGPREVVKDVEVFVPPVPEANPQAAFFAAHPDLADPTGLPQDEALARLRAAGFVCAESDPGDGRPHLICKHYHEQYLGGTITRLRLYPDGQGVIRDASTYDTPGMFDAERCMLPGPDDSPTQRALKGAIFPVRLGCRYFLVGLVTCAVAPLQH
jgi:hypothetical protein